MKTLLISISAIIIATSCFSNGTPQSQQSASAISIVDSTKGHTAKNIDLDNNCDSLKFPDFKNNLRRVELKADPAFEMEVSNIAKAYINQQCKEDTIYCGDVYLKQRNYFLSQDGVELFSFGYAFKNTDTQMEEQSASFFVFGLKKGEKTTSYDIASDFTGEIQLNLTGIETNKDRAIIWGEMYSYFSKDYGKFKLTMTDKNKNYEFACHDKSG